MPTQRACPGRQSDLEAAPPTLGAQTWPKVVLRTDNTHLRLQNTVQRDCSYSLKQEKLGYAELGDSA